jgi:hypothetical protein
MTVQSKSNGPYIKGIVASNQPYAQPKGSVPRASNLIFTSRGALDTCDGSALVHAFNGAIQTGRGKCMDTYLFAPTGVSRYYLAIFKALDIPLGPPQNLTVSESGSGGTLPTATYFYVVTAIDGAGGETTASNEVSQAITLGQNAVLVWNVVPNAVYYNVYRGTASGAEGLLIATTLPVSQVVAGTLTVTFTDGGVSQSVTPETIISAVYSGSQHTPPGAVATFTVASTALIPAGLIFTPAGSSNPDFDTQWKVTGVPSGTQFIAVHLNSYGGPVPGPGESTTGGTFNASGALPPSTDTTQQTALFKMPVIAGSPAVLPVSYNNSNIVALFPADPLGPNPDGGGGGGSGGGGGTGGGGATGGGSTPSGGIPGNVSLIPQMVQFTNRMIIALGNGFPPQVFSDPTTLVNPATVEPISTVSVDAFGVVTVTVPAGHGIPTAAVGGNVTMTGVANPLYDYVGPTIAIVSSTVYNVRNLAAIGQAASTGGTSTTTALPIYNTFVPAFPQWAATALFDTGDVIQPVTQPSPAIYLTCTQGGTTGATEPTWPSGGLASIGQSVSSGTAIFQVTGLLNSAAPPPPGAAHIIVYGGALWVFDTSTTNTSSGLDGPCSLRQSSINNPNSWNPINQAFLDKDDGTEGMGLAKFTITAQGIPPEGSLVAFKNFQGYQIIGIFGASSFAIQAISSDMGCISPRTLLFVPGFGVSRMTHLGIATFNGVQDLLVSEQIRPYLYPTNDSVYSDITVIDSSWISVAWGAQTANPPMYCLAVPIGNSSGQLTRLLCFDLVLKAWAIVDLPFPISTMSQFKSVSANPVTILGGFSDGLLSRWQAGDVEWDTGGTGARTPTQVASSGETLTAASQDSDQVIYCRRWVISLINSGSAFIATVTPKKDGKLLTPRKFYVPANSDFDIDCAFGFRCRRISAVFTMIGNVEIDGDTCELEPRPAGVVIGV